MKKIGMFLLVLSTFFLLAACDQLPNDLVDDIKEETCRENPDSELCQLEDINDLQEDVIKDLALQAFNNVLAGNTSVCEDYFSYTNLTLLEECEKVENNLIPNGLTSLSNITVTNNGTTYTLVGTNNEETLDVTLVVSIGKTEETYLITDWSLTVVERSVMTNEEFIKAFIEAYQDSSVTTDSIISDYLGGTTEADFAEDRLENMNENLSILVNSIVMNTDGTYTVNVTFSSLNGQDSDDLIVKVHEGTTPYLEFIDDDSEEPCTDGTCQSELTIQEVQMVMEQFIMDYQDSTITDMTFAQMYFAGMLDDGFMEDRTMDLVSNVTYTFVDVFMNADGLYTLKMERTQYMELSVVEVWFTLEKTTSGYYIEFYGEDNDCDGLECLGEPVPMEEAKMVFEDFISQYTDPNVSTDDLVAMFFANMIDDSFYEERAYNLSMNMQINVLSFLPFDMDYYDVEIEIILGNERMTEQVVVRVNRLDMAYVIIMDGIDDDCDGIDDDCNLYTKDEMIPLLNQYFQDFSNPDLTDEYLANMYYNGFVPQDVLEERAMLLGSNGTATLLSVTERYDSFFDIEYELRYSNEVHIRKRPGRIKYDMNVVELDWFEVMHEDLELDITVVEQLFKQFVLDYFDASLTDEYISQTYFAGYVEGTLLEERQIDLSDGLVVMYESIEPTSTPGVFEVTIKMTFDGVEMSNRIQIKVKRIDAATPMLVFLDTDDGIDQDCDGYYDVCVLVEDLDVFTSQFNQFLTDVANSNYTNDELYTMYSVQYPFYLIDQRFEQTWTVEYIDGPYDGWFDVGLMAVDVNGDVYYESISLTMFNTETGFILYLYHYDDCSYMPQYCEDPVVYDALYAEEIFAKYLMDFTNPDLTFEDIINTYFLGYEPPFLRDHRSQNLSDQVTYTITDVTLNPNYDGFFDISFGMNTGSFTMAHSARVRIYDYYDVFFIEYFDENNVCHVDPTQCYYEDTYITDTVYLTDFVTKLLADLSNPVLTYDEIYSTYYYLPEVMLEAYFNSVNTVTFELIALNPNTDYAGESFFDLAYKVTVDGVTTEHLVTLRFLDQETYIYIEEMMMYSPVEDFVYMFSTTISSPDVTKEEVCMMVTDASYPLCSAIYDFHMDRYFLEVSQIEYVNEFTVIALLDTYDSFTGELVESNRFEFSMATENPIFEVKTTESTNPLYTE